MGERMAAEIPGISIVIPSYNQGEFIEEAIVSICSQNYPHLELIIMDGGSEDNTVEIIKRYSSQIDFWRSSVDTGQSAAIKEGFNRASGEIIGWLNSDDVLLPNSLQRIGEYATKYKDADIFIGNYLLIDVDGLIISCKRVPKFGTRWLAHRSFWCFNSIGTFYRKTLYDRVGGLNEGLSYVMDADLLMRMIFAGGNTRHIGMYSAGFRRHDDAKTVLFPTSSKDEHAYIAQNSWPNEVGYHYGKPQWKLAFRGIQILNADFLMYFETQSFRGKKYMDWGNL